VVVLHFSGFGNFYYGIVF